MQSETTAEKSLVLLKPDAIHRGLTGQILCRLERKGLKIVGMKMLMISRATAEEHYGIHRDKPFFQDLVAFITSGPIIGMVFQGKGAVDIVRQLMGTTDPARAQPGTIRGDLAMDIQSNLVHGSDSTETAAKEIPLFFSDEEIYNYHRDVDRWLT